MVYVATEENTDQLRNQAELNDKITPEEREARRWIKELTVAEKKFKPWRARAAEIFKRYRDDRESHESGETGRKAARKTNVFWSLVQTEKPHLFMELPRPYIHRRFLDRDPAARDASMILQRCLAYSSEDDESYDALDDAVTSFQLTARGTTWVRYTPIFNLRTSVDKNYITSEAELPDKENAPNGFQRGSDEFGNFYQLKEEYKAGEKCDVIHVSYNDFLHEVVSDWRNVGWVARRVPMLYEEVERRFGEKIAKALNYTTKKSKTLDQSAEDAGKRADDFGGLFGRADIFEVWDKSRREVIWISPDHPYGVLDKQEDIYGLENFFPCPKPIYGTRTPETLIPIPTYAIVQDALNELDDVTQRIKILIQACRVAGVYDATAGDNLERLIKQTDENDLIPVDSWAAFAERGGVKGVIDFLPLNEIIVVIEKLNQHRRNLMQELYEVTGISDVVRGASDYRETAKAQEIKGDFASMRLRRKQREVARHAREILQIKAEIICRHYSDEEIKQLSSAQQFLTKRVPQQQPQMQQPGQPGQPPQPPQMVEVFDEARWQAALQILRDDATRMLRVKIDNETLSGMNAERDQQQRVQFLQSVGQYISGAMDLTSKAPNFGPIVAELLMFGVRGFPIGRQMEASMEAALEKVLTEGPGVDPNQQQQGKSPEEVQLEARKVAVEEQRLGIEAKRVQIDGQRVQMEMQEKIGRLQVDAQSRAKDAETREAKLVADNQAAAAQVDVQRQQAETQRMQAVTNSQIQLAKLDGDAEGKERERAHKAAEAMSKAELRLAELEAQAEQKHADREARFAETAQNQLFEAEQAERDRAVDLAKAAKQRQARSQPNEGENG